MLPIPKKNNKWKNYTIQFQTYYKATVIKKVLVQVKQQTYKLMEQNGEPRNRTIQIQSTDF